MSTRYPGRVSIILAAYALVSLLSGCYGPISRKSFADDMVVEVWASTDCTSPGNMVAMRATVANTGTKTRSVELTDGPAFDLCVGNPDYRKCWSDGKPLAPDITRLELQAGQSKTIEMNWAALLGDYGVVADYVYASEFRSDHVGAAVDVRVESDCLSALFRPHR